MRWALGLVALAIVVIVVIVAWLRSSDRPPGSADATLPAARDDSQSGAPVAHTPPRSVPGPLQPAPPSRQRAEPAPEPAIVDEPSQPSAAETTSTYDSGVPESAEEERDRRLRSAKWLLRHERFEEAAVAGKDLVERYPRFVPAYEIAIPALCALGEAEEAQDHLSRLIRHRDRRRIARTCVDVGMTLTP